MSFSAPSHSANRASTMCDVYEVVPPRAVAVHSIPDTVDIALDLSNSPLFTVRAPWLHVSPTKPKCTNLLGLVLLTCVNFSDPLPTC